MDRAQAIKRYYSEWWENPRDPRNAVFERLNRYIYHRIPDGHGRRALDLGAGRGRIVSYLLARGYEVTAVEFNEDFVAHLRDRFPEARVLHADVRDLALDEPFDLVTCIELSQVLAKADLLRLLQRLSRITDRLFINISNAASLHGMWVRWRGFQADFIVSYRPRDLDMAMERSGFRIVHRRGIGLVTPITLLSGFRAPLIPVPVANAVNRLDAFTPNICHLYYVEGVSTHHGGANPTTGGMTQ